MGEFLRLFVRRFALLLGAYLLLRLGFYAFQHPTFAAATTGQVLLAFGHGFRFDISALLLLNLPWLVLSLVPSRRSGWQRLVRAVYLLLNSLGLALNVGDWVYFGFIGRRVSNELTTLGADVQRQAGQLAMHYWWLLLPFAALLLALAYAYPMPAPTRPAATQPRWSPLATAAALLGLGGLVVLGIRGGWQLKPLRTGAAFAQQPAVLGHLALNSTFTFLKSLGYQPPDRRQYFRTAAALQAALGARPLPTRPAPPLPRANVVVLILESFASEYTGVENPGRPSYTPFFDSLATHGGRLFREHYANGRRSIEALPAVLAGLPALQESPFITSNFQTNELHGLGSLLSQHGYQTSLFHGAQNGTMGFNTFAGMAGMQRYYGLSEYPQAQRSPDYDGQWGIFDGPYLRYFLTQLNQHQPPFFATLFTLSAHDPFVVPPAYARRLPKGTLPIHRPIAYSDAALRQFFAAARQQPWYRNTVFILLADHASQSEAPGYQNELGHYKTPLLIYAPGQALPPANPHRITQQADIPATVLDLLGLPAQGQLLPFGTSVFDTTTTGRALFLSGGSYWLVHHDYVTELTADQQIRLYPYRTHRLLPELPAPPAGQKQRYGQELKACVQYFLNGLADNSLYRQLPPPAKPVTR